MHRLWGHAIVLIVLAGVVAVAGFAAEVQLSPLHLGVDDSYIYFRYARHLAQGLGYVWNPGGERVEGGSSILWTAVCTAILAITPAPQAPAFVAGVAFSAIAASVVVLCIARLLDHRLRPGSVAIAVVMVAAWMSSSPGWVVWMTAARMDTPLWTATLVVAWWAATALVEDPTSRGRQAGLSVAAVLVALGRPEGPMVSFCIVGFVAALSLRRGIGVRAALRGVAVPASAVATIVAAILVARRLYFGEYLPNTWYAKVDSDLGFRIGEGAHYVWSFAAAFPVASVAWLLSSAFVIVRGRNRAAVLASLMVSLGTANAVFVGGDHFGSWRILQPYWLLALVPIVGAFSFEASRRWRVIAPFLVGVAVAAFTLATGRLHWNRLADGNVVVSFLVADAGHYVAAGFAEVFPRGVKPTVGVIGAGTFPFEYEGQCFDLLGLNDVAMAHASGRRRGVIHGHGAFHAPAFFERPPDLLIGMLRPGSLSAPAGPAERIPFGTLSPAEESRFDALYAPVAISTEGSRKLGMMMPAWARRDWLAQNAGRFPIQEIDVKPATR